MIIFNPPLVEGKLILRYKRFLADIALPNGENLTVHVPNSGSMLGIRDPGMPVLIQDSQNEARKLRFTLKMIQATSRAWVGVDTGVPNQLVAEETLAQNIPELTGYANQKREVKYGVNSRIDLYLTHPERPACYVEVKNVTLRDGNAALFPDGVTSRGVKHLHELMEMVKQGHRAVMFFLVERSDCTTFGTAAFIDPLYAKTLREALIAGVELICYDCILDPMGIRLNQPMSFDPSLGTTPHE